tara:strand:+ start:336 stop:1136 length:801 start_codon:yes stop_codon:yes gene_type:complete
MNINTVRSGMLGKRKRVNNRNNVSNRPQKRTDLSMIAEVGKVTPDKINIRLPRRIVNELRDLNKKSSRNRWEYAGKIEFRPNPNKSMVKFNNPQRFTSQLRNAITSETYQLLYDSYIAYHTHPTAYTPNNLKNNNAMNVNNNARKILVTLPSGADMEAYIGTYPNMQANMISDENGYYVIDLIETTGREKPNAVEVNRTMEWLRTQPFFQDRYRTLGGYEYFETTLTDWKKSINQELNPFLQRLFGISIKYYGYNDEPAIITLTRS